MLPLILILLIWHLASLKYPDSLIPSPFQVMSRAYYLVISGRFLPHFLATLTRVSLGFTGAFTTALVFSIILSNFFQLKEVSSVITILNMIPSIIWIFIFIIVIGPFSSAIIASIYMNSLPRFINYFRSGINNFDQSLAKITQVYKIKGASKFLSVTLPQLWVVIFPSIRNEIANAWKVAIISEVFGVGTGIGYQIYYSFGIFSVRDVLAWATLFILFVLILEIVLIRPLEKWTFRWKNI